MYNTAKEPNRQYTCTWEDPEIGKGGSWEFFKIGVANREVGVQPIFIWLNG